jgi:Ala-tRNA(Pro) deacylase
MSGAWYRPCRQSRPKTSFCGTITDRLKKYLGVDPGAVTIFALINDPGHAVELILDESLWAHATFQFHPLVNTSTLMISRTNLKRFLAITGHEVNTLVVPEQNSGNKKSDQ